jgi:hypothetical protein
MKLTYDPQHNIGYIRFRAKTSGVETIGVKGNHLDNKSFYFYRLFAIIIPSIVSYGFDGLLNYPPDLFLGFPLPESLRGE